MATKTRAAATTTPALLRPRPQEEEKAEEFSFGVPLDRRVPKHQAVRNNNSSVSLAADPTASEACPPPNPNRLQSKDLEEVISLGSTSAKSILEHVSSTRGGVAGTIAGGTEDKAKDLNSLYASLLQQSAETGFYGCLPSSPERKSLTVWASWNLERGTHSAKFQKNHWKLQSKDRF
eukprot:TRINITY_DN5558_c0_g1_i1.p1 TRINITY_DN5558_c0_g1~~TRINITY_DN5558_c0_g1_i1.p1  ORF type:complete len:206 (-),score=57.04 TRINITY_DN5558_c0_g1_i1:48-578(-)